MITDYKVAVSKLKELAKAYYELNSPLVTDEEYDILYREIKAYELTHPNEVDMTSPTNVVGVDSTFNKVPHVNRMWSQQDIFNLEELNAWFNKVNLDRVTSVEVEPKYDGLSLKLIYRNGKLAQAVTRGDGDVGEDVTHNAKVIANVKQELEYTGEIEINGEVVIGKGDFDRINELRLKEGLELYANPRNLAAGSMRLLDSKITATRKLRFMPWELVTKPEPLPEHDDIAIIASLGFEVSSLCVNVTTGIHKGIQKAITNIHNQRDKYDIPLDGCVIKILDANVREELGYTSKFPKWACAYKFPAVEKTTTVLDIINQVGRSGKITPVAVLEPTDIDGSVVRKATLHNYDVVASMDIRVNDQVVLIKSGDIIPKIVKVFKDRRNGTQQPMLPITVCPVCGSALVKDSVDLRCVNEDCRGRITKTIEFFASRGQMNIDGLGTSVADDLFSNNLVKSVLDIYTLSKQSLLNLPGYKETKVANLLQAIENSKRCELYTLIAALGIKNVGRTVSKLIVNKLGLSVLTSSVEELTDIPGVGKEIASNLVTYLNNNQAFISSLIETIKPIIKVKLVTDSKYSGKNIVLTGSMEGGKESVKVKLESYGANITSSVSSNTAYVVYGEKAGSKLAKAKQLNIPTISYTEI